MDYQVKTRYGWGFSVIGPKGWESSPMESAIAAQEVADAMNAGGLFPDAVVDAKLHFESGRYYLNV